MSIKLRDLIRQVRSCKTAAEERAVILKECAEIRTAIKDEDSPFRHRNLAKLLYINMLGHSTDFAQMECIKLIASPKFPEKRVGYLGLTLLLDEQTEVLMMVTNSVKRDLNHENPYIIGLALSALCNVCSPAIARDLASEINRLLHDGNPYIRKKAALAAVRFMRKAPELLDDFAVSIPELLNGKNHGVLLAGTALATEMVLMNKQAVKAKFTAMMGDVLRLLKNLASGYAPEHEVSGVADPFLQAKLIRFLRLLVSGDNKTYDDMTDVLGTVASNTETSKNPGNAILYECVQTIMSIKAEPGLRVMAVNILGRFLLNRDNNIRYVALNTLCKCGKDDVKAIQRHRNTIVDCLKDADISIRRRALDLVYSLVNKSNVKALVKELVNYLVLASADVEFRGDLTEKITLVIERFAPDPMWQIDMTIKVLQAAGNLTKENVASNLITLIGQASELHAYAVFSLYNSIKVDISQTALVQVAVWAIGEFGEKLCSSNGASEATAAGNGGFSKVEEQDVIILMQKILSSKTLSVIVKEYSLTAICKLSTRFSAANSKLAELMSGFMTSYQLELQSRANEYMILMSPRLSSIRGEILAPIPPLDTEYVKKRKAESGPSSPVSGGIESATEEDESEPESSPSPVREQAIVEKKEDKADSLFDLDSLLSGPKISSSSAVSNANTGDLLASLFPIASSTPPSSVPSLMPASAPLDSLLLSIPKAEPKSEAVEVFSKNGVRITFEFEKKAADMMTVTMKASNSSGNSYSGFQILVAVPTYIKLKMFPPSSTVLGGTIIDGVVQKIDLQNTKVGEKSYAVRLKIDGDSVGHKLSETAQFSNFP